MSKRLLVFVVAGNYAQAKHWMHSQGLKDREQARYVESEQDLRGVRDVGFVRVGTWYEHHNIRAIDAELARAGLQELGTVNFWQAFKRPDDLDGPTYCETLGDGSHMYIIINEHEGKPCEVFVRYGTAQNGADTYEWVTALTTMITRLLRAGETLETIGKELLEIHGPNTGHMVPGTSELCPSIVARIGRCLVKHTVVKKEEAA